jgi:hypothetical protein
VGNHGPAGKDKGGDAEDGKEIDRKAHGEQTGRGQSVGPHDHFVEVVDILVSLLRFQLLPQDFQFGVEPLVVEIFQPLVGIGQFRVAAMSILGGKERHTSIGLGLAHNAFVVLASYRTVGGRKNGSL